MSASQRKLLLRALLDSDDSSAAEAGREWLSGTDLQRVDAAQARMLPMLYKRLQGAGVEEMPPLMRGTYRKAWTQSQVRFRAVAGTLQALDAAGIPTAVLKGAALIPAYGGDWGLRDMSDVDVLIGAAQLPRAAAVLADRGWQPGRGLTHAGVVARFADRRHSWNYEHPDGHQLDLHWHVFASSRGPGVDAPLLEAAVPLEIGPVRTRRLCDADLLLHVLEHARHGEPASQVQWVVDATLLLRSAHDPDALSKRLAETAAAHELTDDARRLLEMVDGASHAPAAAQAIAALERTPAPRPRWLDRKLGDHRRGGIATLPAIRSAAAQELDGRLARRRGLWAGYVLTGRRAGIERAMLAARQPLTRPPAPVSGPPRSEDGWLDFTDGAVIDAVCGPGWSYPEPDAGGAWTDGREARLSLPRPSPEPLVVEMALRLLPANGGDPRRVAVRIDGRPRRTLAAQDGFALQHVVCAIAPRPGSSTLELSLLVDDPARPADLGLGADTRRLGALVHRVRVKQA